MMNKYEEIYKKKSLPWGREKFYQSFKALGLVGERNTEDRIEKYKLKYLLEKNMSVLDIGSNCGFLDLYISEHVKDVEGVEVEEHLVELSNLAKDELKFNNATFYNEDFKKFKTDKRYDLILSLAEHAWMHCGFKDYIKSIKKLLVGDGLLLIESHKINIGIDTEFKERLIEIEELGFTKLYESKIDEGRDERIFAIFRLGKFERVKIKDIIEVGEVKYYRRLDLGVTYATIEELIGGSNSCALYRRYHLLRHGWTNMNKNLITLKKYVDIVSKGLGDLLKPIKLDSQNGLFDGCHRLTSAIYCKQEYILVKKLDIIAATIVDSYALLKKGASYEDVNIMQEKAIEIVRSYNE